MITLYADRNNLVVRKKELLTSGSINTTKCHFDFSEDWAGLEKTVLFRTKSVSIATILDEKGDVYIPAEALAIPYIELSVGVYGTSGSSTVLPTIWTSLGIIARGVNPGSACPGVSMYDKILAEIAQKGDGLKYEDGVLSLLSGENVISAVEMPIGETEEDLKKYVDDKIRAALGDISTVLDSINGEVV